MKYKKLGNTDLEISQMGYGTWQIANDPGIWTGADPEKSLICLKHFVENGGNFIDTAWVYGWSENKPNKHPSEELIGRFLNENNLKDKVIVATKIAPKNMKWPAWRNVPMEEVFPISHIEKCVDDSLMSLGLETIDLMQFHVWQDAFIENHEWQTVVERITKSGKVRYWGLSLNDYQPTNCFNTLESGIFSSVQTIFNVFHQKPKEKLFQYTLQNGIGVIARVTLDEGGLSGKLNPESTFDKGDFRKDYFTRDRLVELEKRNKNLELLCKKYQLSGIPELAFRFVISEPAVTTFIPGMRQLKNLKMNLETVEKGPLPTELIEELSNHSWERNFYPDVDPSLVDSGYLEK